jgi:hypothetical protein
LNLPNLKSWPAIQKGSEINWRPRFDDFWADLRGRRGFSVNVDSGTSISGVLWGTFGLAVKSNGSGDPMARIDIFRLEARERRSSMAESGGKPH